MRQMAILFTLFFPIILFSMETPVQIQLKKNADSKYSLNISVPKGFAIQKDAPNKINLKTEGGLKVDSFNGSFTGNVSLENPEYYEKVNEFPLQMKGTGSLIIDSKIFYCDLQRGICYPAKIQKKEIIQ